jgi:hypothetical protein
MKVTVTHAKLLHSQKVFERSFEGERSPFAEKLYAVLFADTLRDIELYYNLPAVPTAAYIGERGTLYVTYAEDPKSDVAEYEVIDSR